MTTSNQNQKNRFDWIDRTKGLAILGIVLFHFFQNYPERSSIINLLDRNSARVGYAAVDIFFVMAGFNTSYSLLSRSIQPGINKINTNWKSWLGKRLFRLYPSYWLAVILTCLLYYLFSGKFQITWNLKLFLSILGLAGVHTQAFNPGFWFFSVILQAYLLTPLIFILGKNKPQQILWIGIILGVFTKMIASYLLFENYLFENNNIGTYLFFLQNNFIGSYISQFCLGLYWGFIYNEHQDFRKIDFVLSTAIFALGLMVYGFFVIQRITIIYMLGFDMLFTPFMFLAMKAFVLQLEKIVSLKWILAFISILGIYSYQIYLLHQPLYFVSLYPLTKNININSYASILITLLISLCLLTIYVFGFIKLEQFVMKRIETVSIKK